MGVIASEAPAPLLRLAEAADGSRVFAWRNDPWIVSLSTSRQTVTPEEHAAWFPSALDRARHLLFIIHAEDGEPAGTLRLDRNGEETAVLTVYLLRQHTGRGLGPRAITAACGEAFSRWSGLTRVIAHVRSDNQPSLKAFARAGFQPAPGEAECPPDHVALVHRRGSP
jgi:RimJ/RimL family protein N-acetyltransferase